MSFVFGDFVLMIGGIYKNHSRCTSENCAGYFKLNASMIRVFLLYIPIAFFVNLPYSLYTVYAKPPQPISSGVRDNHTRGTRSEREATRPHEWAKHRKSVMDIDNIAKMYYYYIK